jgi:hypothetical protein
LVFHIICFAVIFVSCYGSKKFLFEVGAVGNLLRKCGSEEWGPHLKLAPHDFPFSSSAAAVAEYQCQAQKVLSYGPYTRNI